MIYKKDDFFIKCVTYITYITSLLESSLIRVSKFIRMTQVLLDKNKYKTWMEKIIWLLKYAI